VWNGVAVQQAQDALRAAFCRWGLPGALRLDNGYPWGSWSELPTALALWLAGLGVGLLFNPPRRPRDNPVVERSHGVSKAWAEVETCHSAEELQARLDDADKIQREEYPLRGGKSRWELFAELRARRRGHDARREGACWQERLAREYLAGQVALRRVDSQGKVTVYATPYYVGIVHRQRLCVVRYDADAGEWVFSSEDGTQWCHRPAQQITTERIRSLTVSAKPSRNHGKTSCPN
jgi:hypothetical protein